MRRLWSGSGPGPRRCDRRHDREADGSGAHRGGRLEDELRHGGRLALRRRCKELVRRLDERLGFADRSACIARCAGAPLLGRRVARWRRAHHKPPRCSGRGVLSGGESGERGRFFADRREELCGLVGEQRTAGERHRRFFARRLRLRHLCRLGSAREQEGVRCRGVRCDGVRCGDTLLSTFLRSLCRRVECGSGTRCRAAGLAPRDELRLGRRFAPSGERRLL
mmetsp:Transcript_47174/g.157197  ORF Transcript_47174/g.157197 Transcript_47174/m.157197 type:complete len:223 (+) Transcript_47174:724-1392(+)